MKDKMLIWGAPLADHLGGMDMLEQLIMDGAIEIYPLSHMRGRSICDSIVICDECENMNDKLVTLLMSRIEENSELIFCGDVAQIDSNRFVKNNGIKAMLKHLSGHPLFGTVKLVKSERGAVAQLCDRILPPKYPSGFLFFILLLHFKPINSFYFIAPNVPAIVIIARE